MSQEGFTCNEKQNIYDTPQITQVNFTGSRKFLETAWGRQTHRKETLSNSKKKNQQFNCSLHNARRRKPTLLALFLFTCDKYKKVPPRHKYGVSIFSQNAPLTVLKESPCPRNLRSQTPGTIFVFDRIGKGD